MTRLFLPSSLRLRPRPGAPLCCAATAVVAALGAAVYLDSALVRLDLAAVRLLHRLSFDEATALATGITDLASTTTVLFVASAAAASLALRGHWHGAISVAVSVGATQIVVYGIKALVARGRPPASSAFVDAAGYAFPSAHAASGVALYGLLALLTLRRLNGRVQVAAGALALVAVGSIGVTRVYLGAHYPSDVLAGWLVGAVVAAGAWSLASALRTLLPRRAFA